MFRLLSSSSSAFFRCIMLSSGAYTELRTEPFIKYTGDRLFTMLTIAGYKC